ncbi:MAG: hypothetical protein ORN51_07120 [Akkermansiaceae bacterium]|nr:hypothetical protein [Akkermansiaceae bacterium]
MPQLCPGGHPSQPTLHGHFSEIPLSPQLGAAQAIRESAAVDQAGDKYKPSIRCGAETGKIWSTLLMAGKRYQVEPGEEFREQIWERGHLTALQMFRIAAWKSARGLASLTLNSEKAIRGSTAAAITTIRPWRKSDVICGEVDWSDWLETVATAIGSKRDRRGLLALEGFGYPMASAFLSFLAPGAFPVIDRWTVQAVYGASVASKPGIWQRSSAYAHFAEQLASRRTEFPEAPNIHRLDQAVMNKAIGCKHGNRPCDCFRSWPVALPTPS